MTIVWLAIALWAAVIINRGCYALVQYLHRNTTEQDAYYDRLDQELDELEARRATRPTGNCDVIPLRPRERTRGDVA